MQFVLDRSAARSYERPASPSAPVTRSSRAPTASSATAVAAVSALVTTRFTWKHCRQSTGRPCVGLNGTVVSIWHSEHSVRVSVLVMLAWPWSSPPGPGRDPSDARFALHGLHRFGSFLNCLSRKNICSPAVKTNWPWQSTQVNSRSLNSDCIAFLPSSFERRAGKSMTTHCAISTRRGNGQTWILGAQVLDAELAH
jgi:hypothetical protein